MHRLSRNRKRDQRRYLDRRRPASAGENPAALNSLAPAAEAIVTGKVRYTLDTEIEGLLHWKLLRLPHAHARMKAIRKEAALKVEGVRGVYTWKDVPRLLYTSATHDDYHADPNDTYLLDDVVRFVWQRVVAVVADTEGAAEEGCRKVEINYEVLA